MRKKILILVSILITILIGVLAYAIESSLIANVNVLGNVSFVTINSLIDSNWYNTRSILLNVSLIETVKYLHYKINAGSYSQLCTNCYKYTSKKRFAEGQNNLTVRAITYSNDTYYSPITFYTDSIKPKVHKIHPKSYGNGLFGVQYTEANLEKVTLYYWPSANSSLIETEQFNCISGSSIWCYKLVDLSALNGQYIYYKFELKDKFFSRNSSKKKIKVDVFDPILNVYSPKNNSNYTNKDGNVYLNVTANEKSKLEYKDNNLAWVSLCSGCTYWKGNKKFSFSSHNVTFKATDYAGNFDEELVSFFLKQY